MLWIPRSDEKQRIRAFAAKEAHRSAVRLEPGVRFRVNDDTVDPSLNILRVTEAPEDWDDTDLAGTQDWTAFTRGVPLTDDGRAVVDFYVYTTGFDSRLVTNVTVYYGRGNILDIKGV